MGSVPATTTVTPLEEKVVVVEQKVQNSQYALKFAGAAFSSKDPFLVALGVYTHTICRHGIISFLQSNRHVSVSVLESVP